MRLITVILLILNGNLDNIVSQSQVFPSFWSLPTSNSPDYHHPARNDNRFSTPSNFAGFQNPKSNLGYFGLLTYKISANSVREYIQGQLKYNLIQDSTYCFEIYLSLADSMTYTIKNSLGVFFSISKVDSSHLVHQLLQFSPQIEFIDSVHFTDKVNWVKYSASYKAQGGESYIVIGNFRPDSLLDTLKIIGSSQSVYEGTYYYIDNIWLSHCDSVPDSLVSLREQSLNLGLSVYPNPFEDRVTVKSKSNQNLSFQMYNTLGQSVVALSGVEVRQHGPTNTYQINTKNIPEGLYWLRVSDGKREETVKLMKR